MDLERVSIQARDLAVDDRLDRAGKTRVSQVHPRNGNILAKVTLRGGGSSAESFPEDKSIFVYRPPGRKIPDEALHNSTISKLMRWAGPAIASWAKGYGPEELLNRPKDKSFIIVEKNDQVTYLSFDDLRKTYFAILLDEKHNLVPESMFTAFSKTFKYNPVHEMELVTLGSLNDFNGVTSPHCNVLVQIACFGKIKYLSRDIQYMSGISRRLTESGA